MTSAQSGAHRGDAAGRDVTASIRAWMREHAALVALGLVLLVISVFTASQSWGLLSCRSIAAAVR